MAFTFPKNEKLKSRKQIERLFREGASVSEFPLKLIYIKTDLPKGIKVKVAMAVPKRCFKSAVKRNRIKRLMREAYRLNKHCIFNNIEGNYAFLFLYIGPETAPYNVVEERMLRLFNKFLKKIPNAKIDQ